MTLVADPLLSARCADSVICWDPCPAASTSTRSEILIPGFWLNLFSSSSSNDESINLTNFTTPVGHFNFMPGTHNCDIVHVYIAEDNRQTFRSNFWLILRRHKSHIIFA